MTHIPVLLNVMLSKLSPQNGSIYVDATFGAGGYSEAILKSADCEVYAIDRDETVVKFYNNLNLKYPGKIKLFIDKFSNIRNIIDSTNLTHVVVPSVTSKPSSYVSSRVQKQKETRCEIVPRGTLNAVDGVVFDIGMSSMQLADGDRGFSFLRDGPLDMRMDISSPINASTFVNCLCEKEIAEIITNYGEDRYARRIARAIVSARKKRSIKTTFDLAEIIRSVVYRGKSRIDPATRTFQAIRIWVNDELGELQKGIQAASDVIKKNGKIIVLSFHSLEDRIVKHFFKDLCKSGTTDFRTFTLLNKKVITASPEERGSNPRARSAKLRAVERLS